MNGWYDNNKDLYPIKMAFVCIFLLKEREFWFHIGDIHKPRGLLRGKVVSQMTIFLHKPYLVKVITKGGEGVKNTQKFDHVVYGFCLDDPFTNSPLICFEFVPEFLLM